MTPGNEVEVEVERLESPSFTPPPDAAVLPARHHPCCGFVPDIPRPMNLGYPFGYYHRLEDTRLSNFNMLKKAMRI